MNLEMSLPLINGVSLKNDMTINELIDINVKTINEYYNNLCNSDNSLTKEQKKFNLIKFRNLLLKEMLLNLCIKPGYADEIMAIIDERTEDLYNE